MRSKATSMIIILMLILSIAYASSNRAYSQQTSWIITRRTGEWDKVEPNDFSTEMSPGDAEITFKASGILMGYLRLTFNIDLSGTSGSNITGKLILTIEELNFSVEYVESYMPGFYGLNDRISNRLTITINDDKPVDLEISANWPMDSRLNNRFYIWFWRSEPSVVTWVVSDGYMQRDSDLGMYYNGTIGYGGEDLTITLTGIKSVDKGEGKLSAFLIYNEIDASGSIFDEFELKVVDYGFNSFFYLSIAFFITVMTGHLLHKALERELKLKTEGKLVTKERPQKGRRR